MNIAGSAGAQARRQSPCATADCAEWSAAYAVSTSTVEPAGSTMVS